MDGSQLFIVRVWPEPAGFRASARAVDREETQLFREPVALLRFLCDGVDGAPAAPPLLPAPDIAP